MRKIPIMQGYKHPPHSYPFKVKLPYYGDCPSDKHLWASSCNGDFRDVTERHQLENIGRQIRGGDDKAICCCATMHKGGGNNAVTYVVELYESV